MLMWEMRRIIMKHRKVRGNILNYKKHGFHLKHEKNNPKIIFFWSKLRVHLEIYSFELEKQFFFNLTFVCL